MVEPVGWLLTAIEGLFLPAYSSRWRKGAPDTVPKATRYTEWYKQENPNRSPYIDQLFDAVIETRKRQAAGEKAERATEHLLDAAFIALDRHAASGKPSPRAEKLATAALLALMGGGKGAPDTVSKATRYAEWYKQENPNRSPHIDQLFDAVIETRERQAAGEKAERATERLLDAAFKELDRHAVSGKPSPRAEKLATAALLALMGGGKGAPDTVSKATRYAEWYKQENPNRSPHIDQLFDAVIETRERQAAGEKAERATERLLDAAFKELDRHAVSGEASPVIEEFVAAALVILDCDILPDKYKEDISD